MPNNNLVYSTDGGRIKHTSTPANHPRGDGIVRVHKETKGRKGAGVSIIKGLELAPNDLKTLCSTLKKKCGCGGSVKGNNIEIQGDVRDRLKVELENRGHTVKLAGG